MTTLNHDLTGIRKRALELRNELHMWLDSSHNVLAVDNIERALKRRELLAFQLDTVRGLELDIVRDKQLEMEDQEHLLEHVQKNKPIKPWELEIMGYAKLDTMRFQVDCANCRSFDPNWSPTSSFETLKAASEALINHFGAYPSHSPFIERV